MVYCEELRNQPLTNCQLGQSIIVHAMKVNSFCKLFVVEEPYNILCNEVARKFSFC